MSERRVPSSEFRVTFPRLEQTVVVTSMGRAIGVWTPVGEMLTTLAQVSGVPRDSVAFKAMGLDPDETLSSPSVAGAVPAARSSSPTTSSGATAGMSQAEKDRVLRSVAKGK